MTDRPLRSRHLWRPRPRVGGLAAPQALGKLPSSTSLRELRRPPLQLLGLHNSGGKMQMQMTKRPDFQSSDREEGPFSRKQSPV